MPARLMKMKAAAKEFGIDLDQGGSHWIFRRERDGLIYPVPAHNGLKSEIGDEYIRGFCRTFGLDRESFKRSL